jgi:A/G-specific adenine glycosylase
MLKPRRDSAPRQDDLATPLLAWYDRHHRSLPWRSPPGAKPMDPYRVWLSEIMLQQTTVPAVIPYFLKFTARWPRVQDLAAAETDEVTAAWAGLGYYARARNLHKCAQVVSTQFDGVFPDSEAELLKLPGVGAYTAAAIAAIAFDKPAAVLDGNIERVLARVFAVETPLPKAKPELRVLAARVTPDNRPGDFAQAMMDLGATICTPRNPDCLLCPLAQLCAGRRLGIAGELPRKAPKASRPVRHAIAFLLQRDDGAVLLRRRPPKGLLGGMLEVPSTPWREEAWQNAEAATHAPVQIDWQPVDLAAEHVFTHFALKIGAVYGRIGGGEAATVDGIWEQPQDAALPTVMRKMLGLLPRDGRPVRSTRNRRGGQGRP